MRRLPTAAFPLLVSAALILSFARDAGADRLALVEPSGSLQAAVARAMRKTSVDLLFVHGMKDAPRKIGDERDARFVVWREGGSYVLWDAATRREQRLAAASLDDEVTATAVADDIVAWIVAAGDMETPEDVSGLHARLLALDEMTVAVPAWRLELNLSERYRVANKQSRPTMGLAVLRRVGAMEAGLGFSAIMAYSSDEWQQVMYLAHARLPIYARNGKGSIIPRVGAGILLGRFDEAFRLGSPPTESGSGVWPVAEVGVTLERRWHRVALGLDFGATVHLRQDLEEVMSVDIPPHVEPAMGLRLGLLLY